MGDSKKSCAEEAERGAAATDEAVRSLQFALQQARAHNKELTSMLCFVCRTLEQTDELSRLEDRIQRWWERERAYDYQRQVDEANIPLGQLRHKMEQIKVLGGLCPDSMLEEEKRLLERVHQILAARDKQKP